MVPIDAQLLEAIISGLRAIPNFGGLAMAIPHKVALADLCDTLVPQLSSPVRSMPCALMMMAVCMVTILMVLVLLQAVTGTDLCCG